MNCVLLFVLVAAAAATHFPGHRRSMVPAVPTKSGVLKGIRSSLELGSVRKYLGVPYAQAPVDDLRFLPPQELSDDAAYEEVDATKFGPPCYQSKHLKGVMSHLLSNDSGMEPSEDCLSLNIYVPELDDDDETPLPVIIWLAGEGFDYADPSQFDGSYLALLGNVIVVTVNYRVSVFGFLSSLTPEAPGNVGLFDQRMAMKWVKENIAEFGGHSKKVTVMGRFTGSMAISMHLTTPLKEKLFEKAILQSGVAVGPYVFDSDPINATNVLAETVGCPTDFIHEMISCLQKIPAKELLMNSNYVSQRFRPVYDGKLVVKEPLAEAKRGHHHHVDVMFGTNSDDGSICLLTLYFLRSHFYNRIVHDQLSADDFSEMVSENLRDFTKKENDLLERVLTHQYRFLHGDKSLRSKYIDFCGTMYITSHVERMAHLMSASKKGKVYVYQFDHRPTFSRQLDFINAAHGDDVLFALGLVHNPESNATSEELELSTQMTAAIGNFARYSNPNSLEDDDSFVWPQFTLSRQSVLHFNTTEQTVSKSTHEGDVSFWHEVAPVLMSHPQEYKQHHHSSPQEVTAPPRYMSQTSSRMAAESDYDIMTASSSAAKGTSPLVSSPVFSVQSAFCVILALAACNIVLLVAGAFVLIRYCRRSHPTYVPLDKV